MPPPPDARPRNWKRTLLPRMTRPRMRMVLLLLAGGAIVNVGVAWIVSLTRESGKEHVWIEPRWPEGVPTGWPHVSLFGTQQHSFGNYTARAGLQIKDDEGKVFEVYTAIRSESGLPFGSLAALKYSHKNRNEVFERSPNSKVGLMVKLHRDVILPVIPIWPGFAINTIFYAAILWLLFATSGFVRRRIRARRGQCPACAYPIGSSTVCTECGKPVPDVVYRRK